MHTLRSSLLLGLAFAASLATAANANVPSTCLGCNFAHADLHGADMRGVEYVGSNFERANLRNANLQRAKLMGVNFSTSDMQNAEMQSSVLIGANFSGAQLNNASFRGATICVLGDDGISCIDLSGATVNGADFRGALYCRGRHMSDCVPVTVAMLRDRSHNTLNGAILP